MTGSHFRALMGVLRELLRARGLRHSDIAERLNVTERTVTRWFSRDGVDTRVVEQLCDLAGISFFGLCELAGKRIEQRISNMTVKQERMLSEDALLDYLFSQILKGWSTEELRREARIPEAVLVGALIRLEKIGLIELLPGNEIRLLTNKDIKWRPNGPYSRFVNKFLAWSLDNADVSETDAVWVVDALKFSAASRAQLEQKFRKLLQEARELSDIDRRSNAGASEWYTFVLAARPFELGPFSDWSVQYDRPRKRSAKSTAA
ncbi:MAG: family transcriptional regulator [Rhodospirillales bacterium]|nr:family transcriptional regulator [Rhodospirillales bacterium]